LHFQQRSEVQVEEYFPQDACAERRDFVRSIMRAFRCASAFYCGQWAFFLDDFGRGTGGFDQEPNPALLLGPAGNRCSQIACRFMPILPSRCAVHWSAHRMRFCLAWWIMRRPL